MANAWMSHLASFRKKNPKLSLREAMGKAKGSYKKVGISKTHNVKREKRDKRRTAKKGKNCKKGKKGKGKSKKK